MFRPLSDESVLYFTKSLEIDKPAIFRWVASGECTTANDIATKYTEIDEFDMAMRMFDVLKSSDSIFAAARDKYKWNPRQLTVLALAHAESPFTSIDMAIAHLKSVKSSKRALEITGSYDSLKVLNAGVAYDNMYRFVNSDLCTGIPSIKDRYDLLDDITSATRMFEVCKAEDSLFKDLRSAWSDEQKVCVAHGHAEKVFGSVAEVNEFLTPSDGALPTPKTRTFSSFVFG